MADFPVDLIDSETISMQSPESAFQSLAFAASTSAAYPAANRAHFYPFVLQRAVLVRQLFLFCGATPGGNLDIGIYDAGLNRLVSSGSTAQTATSAPQFFNITDTPVGPGLIYLAVAADSTTPTWRIISGQAYIGRAIGAVQQATAFPLPATATAALYASTSVGFPGMVIGRMA